MKNPSSETVSHPSHYTTHPSGVECIDIVKHFNFLRGSAIKYVWRADLKGDPIENLEKAREVLRQEINRLKFEKAQWEERAARGTNDSPVTPRHPADLIDPIEYDHLHTVMGVCVINRFGEKCERP